MDRSYDALRAVRLLCKTAAGVTLVAALTVAALVEAFATDQVIGAALSIGAVIVGTVCTLLLFALAEGIKVVMDIERNTRQAVATGDLQESKAA